MKIDLFVFDMGEVVILDGMNLREIAAGLSIDEDALERDYAKYDYPMMEGFMNTGLYMRHLESEFNLKIKGNIFKKIYHPRTNYALLPLLGKIRSHARRLVIGSNTFLPHVKVIEKLDENPLGYFDRLYFSHEMHLSKPSPAFFRYILDREGVKGENVLFIDDREENLNSASIFGIRTFLYSEDRNNELEAIVDDILL